MVVRSMLFRDKFAIVFSAALLFVCSHFWAFAEEADDAQATKDASIVEVLLRLKNFDLQASPPAKAALLRFLARNRGSERYFQLVEKFSIAEESEQLVRLAIERPTETAGGGAAKLLEKIGRFSTLKKKVTENDEKTAVAAVTVSGYIGSREVSDWMAELLVQTKLATSIRASAATGLARNRAGEQRLLELVEAKKLPADLNFTVANILYGSRDEKTRDRVAKHLELPATAQGKPLPPVSKLVSMNGTADKGHQVFLMKGTCIKCHKVRGEGKEVGPDLSEIGSKLSKEAMYVAILNPNAGISHNYETYEVVTLEGQIATGVLVSQSDEEVKLKNAEGIELTFPAGEVDELNKLKVSIMPADLQKNLTVEELTNLVAYLTTLKKKQ